MTPLIRTYLCGALVLVPLCGSAFSIRDEDFAPSDWRQQIFYFGNGVSGEWFQGPYGNPGTCFVFGAATTGMYCKVYAETFSRKGTYDPGERGALDSLRVTLDSARLRVDPSPYSDSVRMAIRQGSKTYFALRYQGPVSLQWQSWTATFIRTDFREVDLSSTDWFSWPRLLSGSHPDFSASAPPMEFGHALPYGNYGYPEPTTDDGVLIDNWQVTAVTTSKTLSGQLVLSDFTGPVEGQTVRFKLFDVATGAICLDRDLNLGASGSYVVNTTTAQGDYVVRFEKRPWLNKAVNIHIGPTGCSVAPAAMTNGDCDGDNEVGIGDYALLSATYGLSLGEQGYDPYADLNGDTAIDIADYAILSANYGQVGD